MCQPRSYHPIPSSRKSPIFSPVFVPTRIRDSRTKVGRMLIPLFLVWKGRRNRCSIQIYNTFDAKWSTQNHRSPIWCRPIRIWKEDWRWRDSCKIIITFFNDFLWFLFRKFWLNLLLKSPKRRTRKSKLKKPLLKQLRLLPNSYKKRYSYGCTFCASGHFLSILKIYQNYSLYWDVPQS